MKQLRFEKWYWFIPLISIVFLYKMSTWVFMAINSIDCGNRMNIIMLTIPIHVFTFFLIIGIFGLI